MIAEVGQRLGRRLDEIRVATEPLLGLVTPRAVVRPLRPGDLCEQVRVLLLEDRELSSNEVLVGPAEDQRSSSYTSR
jgi:hypothetical protein